MLLEKGNIMRMLIFSGLIVLNMSAMEPKHRMSWYHYPLKDLVDATKSKNDLEINEKLAYVEFCKKLYEKSKKRLDEVAQETNGHVSETEDPDTARWNYNKFLKREVMDYCPADIKGFELQIESARKDYINAQKWK